MFIQILMNVIFPVFSLIAVGIFVHRLFHFDMNTLSKLTSYVLLPTVGFVNIYESRVEGELLAQVALFLFLQYIGLILISTFTTKVSKFDHSLSATFKNSVVLNNSGNFGLSVSQLVFANNPIGLSIQVVVMILQTFLTNTYGLYNSISAKIQGSKVFIELLKIPILYALLLGLLLQTWDVRIPPFIWKPIENISDAFFAIGLMTLGAQVAFIPFKMFSKALLFALLGRLVVSPAIAVVVILVLGLEGTVAQALLIASSFPSSRNSALFALEYNNHPELAAQIVLISTLLSCITVTATVYLAQLLF